MRRMPDKIPIAYPPPEGKMVTIYLDNDTRTWGFLKSDGTYWLRDGKEHKPIHWHEEPPDTMLMTAPDPKR